MQLLHCQQQPRQTIRPMTMRAALPTTAFSRSTWLQQKRQIYISLSETLRCQVQYVQVWIDMEAGKLLVNFMFTFMGLVVTWLRLNDSLQGKWGHSYCRSHYSLLAHVLCLEGTRAAPSLKEGSECSSHMRLRKSCLLSYLFENVIVGSISLVWEQIHILARI